MARFSQNHRTSISHFLSNGKWDSEKLREVLRERVCEHIKHMAKKEGQPIFISIDDTVNPKKKPSDKAERPMEDASFVYSHLLGKTVWGHQALAAVLSTGDVSLCHTLELRREEKGGKIQQTTDIAASLPMAERLAYALMDSWYTCSKVIDAFAAKGFHTIGALKVNRIIYPQGIGISIADFAESCIQKSDASLVTVGLKKYWVYRYEGNLNGIDNAVVLITHPEDAFGEAKALRAFICTDTELDSQTILEYYGKRWNIEVFFKQVKNIFGFGGYQMRSSKGIERFWLILSLTVFYLVTDRDKALGTAAVQSRTAVFLDLALLIYCAGRDGVPFNSLPLPAFC